MKKFKIAAVYSIFFLVFASCTLYSENKAQVAGNENKVSEKNNSMPADSSTINKYCWKNSYSPKNTLVNRIEVPEGFIRTNVVEGSYEDWLRHLPLKEGKPKVMLYNGSPKGNQDAHYAVIDIDPGTEDLQQCADAVMRLNAEYHFSKTQFSDIHFKFTSGDNAEFMKWKEGFRPVINGNKVTWQKKTGPDKSYASFKAYMKKVFMYAGTASLSKELISISPDQLKIGDVFIKGGFPGHAVIVIDMAVNKSTGEKIFMIAQSYMPAQEIHVLKNESEEGTNPWYSINFGESLDTPEWTFQKNELKRFTNR